MRDRRRRGFTLIELLIVMAIILTILAIAIPRVSSVLSHTREMAAIKQIQTIQAAQTQYYSQFGRFATKLEELGPPSGGTEGPAGAGLIPGDLAKGLKTGYQFLMVGNQTGYTVNANPVVFGNTGRRTFFSDQSLVIRENWTSEPATLNSPEIK